MEFGDSSLTKVGVSSPDYVMKKFVYHNCKKIGEADLVMVGVPDEKGSKATRHGAGKGPNAIRRASHQRLSFYVRGKEHVIIPERGFFDKKCLRWEILRKKN